MPTLDQFKNGIFVAGSYQGAAPTAPILRNSAGNAFGTMAAPPNGTHFSLSFPPAAPAPRPPASVATTPYLSERQPLGAHAQSGGTSVGFGPPAGPIRVAYLPFVSCMICSMILPADPASNVDFFYTDALSGCMIFIDRSPAGDLVVYHANRMDQTVVPNPAAYLAATPFPGQYTAARNQMRLDKAAANAQMSAAMGGGVLNQVAELWRGSYLLCVENEKTRKVGQGRTNVDANPGTNVMGFRTPGGWQFWWQTWALTTYDRPGLAAIFKGTHQGIQLGTGKLLKTERFF